MCKQTNTRYAMEILKDASFFKFSIDLSRLYTLTYQVITQKYSHS